MHIQEDHPESLCAHPRGPSGKFVYTSKTLKRTIRIVCVHIQEDHQESLCAYPRGPPGEFVFTSKRTTRGVCVHI